MKFFTALTPIVLLAAQFVSTAPVDPEVATLEARAPALASDKFHATLSGSVRIKDKEPTRFVKDVYGTFPIPAHTVTVSKAKPSKKFPVFKKCLDKEVRAELHAFAELDTWSNPNLPRVQIRGLMKLYEGAHCKNNDLEKQHSISGFAVIPGNDKDYNKKLSSGGNYADFKLKAKVWKN